MIPLAVMRQRTWTWLKGADISPENRWSSTYAINLVCIIWLILYFAITSFTTHFKIGLTFHEVKCLDGTGYFIHKSIPSVVERGEKYSYVSQGLKPILADGSTIVKIAAGLPGDKVHVDQSGVYINGKKWGDLNPITMKKINKTVADVSRDFVVGKDEVLMMGLLPRSYDGRYLGAVKRKQLTGKAWLLW